MWSHLWTRSVCICLPTTSPTNASSVSGQKEKKTEAGGKNLPQTVSLSGQTTSLCFKVHFSCMNHLGGGADSNTPVSPSCSPVRGLAEAHPALLGAPPRLLDASLKLMYAAANMPLKAVKQMRPVWLMHAD